MLSGKDRLLGPLATFGPIAFTAAWLIAGLADDEYSARQEDISALAALDAQHPWITITSFLLLALGSIALAGGLALAMARRPGRGRDRDLAPPAARQRQLADLPIGVLGYRLTRVNRRRHAQV